MVFSTASFARETAEKRLDLKSLKRNTKAEEIGTCFCRENWCKTAKPRVHRGETDPLFKILGHQQVADDQQ
jgi:hypothetical protein